MKEETKQERAARYVRDYDVATLAGMCVAAEEGAAHKFNKRQMREYAVRVGEAVLAAAKRGGGVNVRDIVASTSTYGAGW